MKKILSTVTSRGQVTIPAEVRKVLGAKSGDKVAFEIVGDSVMLKRARFTLETAYGSVPPKHRPEDFEAMKDQAMEEHAEEVARVLHRRRR
ncbi:MAG TPA: AbrB/MazE/SpoVT family DNA-binding domain-containing protein [Dehalococcoidia bacterium]|nr:AbrB/MazE/SpoVT family DNA-binding domain-containing protein [Dehalococcoidia bacterium]